MNTKKILFLMPLLSLLLCDFQCNKDFDSYYRNIYDLELPFKVFPAKKTYKVNDTIRIYIVVHNNSMYDQRTGQWVDIHCSDVPIYVYAGVREENYIRRDSSALFDIVVDSTSLSYHTIVSNGQFTSLRANITESALNKGEISLIYLVPKKKGVYLINPTAYYFIEIREPGMCNDLNSITDKGNLIQKFDIPDTNPELIKESPLPDNVFISGDQIPILTKDKRVFWLKITD
ncbi:MAG: hypothetical protein U0V49_00460 [Saprospiraceae bacterium]